MGKRYVLGPQPPAKPGVGLQPILTVHEVTDEELAAASPAFAAAIAARDKTTEED